MFLRLTRVRSEAGDTLVEVLVAMLILGLSATALLGALATGITSSAEHRSLANLDTVVRSFSEQAKYDIELQPSSPWYADCATVSGQNYVTNNGATTNTVTYIPPSGYSVNFTGIQYWNGSIDQFEASNAACNVPTDQTGFQLLTIQATAPNGSAEVLSFAVRSST